MFLPLSFPPSISLLVGELTSVPTRSTRRSPGARKGTGGMYTIPCTTDAVVTMTFGNAAFQIDARDLLFQPLTNDPAGRCISSLSAGTVTDAQTWLLGGELRDTSDDSNVLIADSFLKNVYMTTNIQERTVQLSARTDAPLSSSAGVQNTNAAIEALSDTKVSNATTAVASASASGQRLNSDSTSDTSSSSAPRLPSLPVGGTFLLGLGFLLGTAFAI